MNRPLYELNGQARGGGGGGKKKRKKGGGGGAGGGGGGANKILRIVQELVAHGWAVCGLEFQFWCYLLPCSLIKAYLAEKRGTFLEVGRCRLVSSNRVTGQVIFYTNNG